MSILAPLSVKLAYPENGFNLFEDIIVRQHERSLFFMLSDIKISLFYIFLQHHNRLEAS
jgi:hypothetical protein